MTTQKCLLKGSTAFAMAPTSGHLLFSELAAHTGSIEQRLTAPILQLTRPEGCRELHKIASYNYKTMISEKIVDSLSTM